MNEAYKNLVERRSVRKYNNKKVSHDLVEKIIYAGQCAPSGMNRQIFAFVAVEDEELVKELEKFKKCNKVGVIAGASTPEETINKVISILKNAWKICLA